jgi:hypothetical protein
LAKPPYVTNGNVSNLETDGDQLQITAATIFGNSGGGVYTADGKLLGITRAISVTHGTPYEHAAFAVPIWNVSLFLIDNELSFILQLPGTSLEQSLISRKVIAKEHEDAKARAEKEEAERVFRKQLLDALEALKRRDVAPIGTGTAPLDSAISPINSATLPQSSKKYR